MSAQSGPITVGAERDMTERVKVFLSYRRADTQHVAGRVGDRLGEQFELFMDIDTIPPGVDFTDYVRRAVGRCDVLVAFIGDRWLSLTTDDGRRRIDDPNDWVVEEISVALKRDVRVIPVLVENALMPMAAELPEALRPLVNRQALPLRHSTFSADLTRLVAGIEHAGIRATSPALSPELSPTAAPDEGHLAAEVEQFADRWDSGGHPAPAATVPPVRIPGRPPPRRRLIVGATILLAAALIGAAIAVTKPFDQPSTASPPTATAESPGPSTTPARSLTPIKNVAALRRHLPPTFSQTCRSLEPTTASLRVALTAAAQCVPAEGAISGKNPAYSFYFAYATPEAATTSFHAYYAPGSLASGDCTTEAAELTYARDGLTGTLRCYTDGDGFRVFAWTSDELGIVASAADRSMTYAELARWWRRAGPLP